MQAARARGKHYPHPDPRRQAAYERLERALAELSAPPAREGWQRGVWAAVDRAETERAATERTPARRRADAPARTPWWRRPRRGAERGPRRDLSRTLAWAALFASLLAGLLVALLEARRPLAAWEHDLLSTSCLLVGLVGGFFWGKGARAR